jgi:S1-C subfamily serine protease
MHLLRFFRSAIYYPGLLFWILNGQPARAQTLTAIQNYAINRPGVVMIKTVFTADVYVNKMNMDSRNFNHLLDSIQRTDTSGTIFTAEEKLNIVLKEINNNPSRFFKATLDYIRQPEEITGTGTGFFITNDGYVATNCHLIDREPSYIRRQFILSAFQQITEANIEALESSWATRFTDQQRNLLYTTYASVYSKLFSMVLYGLRKDVYVVFSSDRKNEESTGVKKQVSVVIKGEPMPGKDIAILKIDGETNLPTLKIASSRMPRVGEHLFVYGYPGPVTNNDFVSQESAIEPTLTTGIVSAIKKSTNGWPLIQMDANINHGSSGGPVCNEKGEVVGLTTFGSIENTGGLAAGLNFAIPVEILNEYLDTADVKPVYSKTSAQFAEGIDAFEKEYYRKALNKFEAVKRTNDHYPGLAYYLEASKENIRKGGDMEMTQVRNDLLSISTILLLVVLLYTVLKKRRFI